MKRLIFFCLSVASLAVLASCKEEEPVVSSLSVSSVEISISEEGGSQSLTISSNTSWTITGGKAWLTVNPSTGEGNKVVVLSVTENSALAPRECTLVVSTDDGTVSHNVKVIQSQTAEELSVSVDNLIVSSAAGSASSFNIMSNDTWKISGCPDWIELSTLSGTGDVTVTAKSLTTNYSASDRSADITVSSSTKSVRLTIHQKAAWLSNCVAKPINMAVIYDSAAFEWELSDNVAYYYYGSIEQTEADRMTTMEIVEYIVEGGNRCTPGDNYISSVNYLYSTTDYVLYTVAYDKDGVQGDLYKQTFRTKSSSNQPYALIDDVSYSSTTWYWNTFIGPYASAYYMWASQSYNYYYITDALVAYLMKSYIQSYPDDFPKILQDGDWTMERTGDMIHIVTWGVSSDGELGGYIERFRGELEDDSMDEKTSVSYDEYKELMKDLVRIY
ncbi:MAG: BACON domain-containing protein [Bacteroidales bacterium]|nr:BACON domain-containing protein [Bacteroidales bacterium]